MEYRESLVRSNVLDCFENVLTSDNPQVLEKAIWAVGNLLKSSKQGESFQAPLIHMVHNLKSYTLDGTAMVKILQCVAELLLSKSYALIASDMGIVDICVDILKTFYDVDVLRLTLTILFLLSIDSDTLRRTIVTKGTLESLNSILECNTSQILTDVSLQLLTNVSYVDDNENDILESGILLTVIDLLDKVNEDLLIVCLTMLANVFNSPREHEDLIFCGWEIGILRALKSPIIEVQRRALNLLLNVSSSPVGRKILHEHQIYTMLGHLTSTDSINELVIKAKHNLSLAYNEDDMKEIFMTKTKQVSISVSEDKPDNPMQFFENWESHFNETLAKGTSFPQTQVVSVQKSWLDRKYYLKREKVIRQMLQREIEYVDVLELILKEYRLPFLDAIDTSEPIISAEDIDIIFSFVPMLLDAHKIFLGKLKDRVMMWEWSNYIYDILLDLNNSVYIYKLVLSNYFTNNTLLNDLIMRNNCFQAFLNETRSRTQQNLIDLLLEPILYLPKFIHSLEILVQATPTTHFEYPHLKEILNTQQSLSSILKNVETLIEKRNHIINATIKFTPYPYLIHNGTFINFFNTDRSFIKSGVLLQRQEKPFNIDNRSSFLKSQHSLFTYICLFSDYIILSEYTSTGLTVKDLIHVHTISSIESNAKGKFLRFSICLKGCDPIVFISTSEEEKNTWVEALQKVVLAKGHSEQEKHIIEEIDKMCKELE